MRHDEGRPEWAPGQGVGRERPRSGKKAGGHGEAQYPTDETGPGRTIAWSKRQEEPGDPDRERADQGEMPGKEREGHTSDPDGQRKQHRVDRLGEEQVPGALDVGDDPAALGDG